MVNEVNFESVVGRPGRGEPCAGCQEDDHALQACKGPLTREAFLRGCPWCNSVTHSWDMCKKRARTREFEYHYEVVLRSGRPPLEMKEDWRVKHKERVKEDLFMIGARWPWGKIFANQNRLRAHNYLADPRVEPYLADKDIWDFTVTQSSAWSVENPGLEVAPGLNKPPPRILDKSIQELSQRSIARMKKRTTQISIESSASDVEVVRLKSRRKGTHSLPFNYSSPGDVEEVIPLRKLRKPQSMLRVPENVIERQANEFCKGGFSRGRVSNTVMTSSSNLPRHNDELEVEFDRPSSRHGYNDESDAEFNIPSSRYGYNNDEIGDYRDDYNDMEVDGNDPVVDYEGGQCHNCHQTGHKMRDSIESCGKCGERGHKAGKCAVACKCDEFPGHCMEFCTVICSGIVCKNPGSHRAIDCIVCCICGSRDHYASGCPSPSCLCGSFMQHFGVQCDSIDGPCLRENCPEPYSCTIHCRICGGQHRNFAKWRPEYGQGNCVARRRVGQFKCPLKYCKGTYAFGEDCKECAWRRKHTGGVLVELCVPELPKVKSESHRAYTGW